MKMILVMAALALAGCKKKSEAPSGPSCADAIAKAVGAMPGGPGGGEVQDKLKAVMTTRCTEDAWPPEVIKCYATQAKDMASMKVCRETLPADKQQKLMTDIRGVMMGAGGAGGPMHGAPTGSAPTGSPPPPAGSAATP